MKFFKLLVLIMIIGLSACQSGGPRKAIIETEYGNMTIELYDSTPLHRDNFIKLVEAKFYDDLLFHRIISNFMFQGGDPNSRGADANLRLGGGGPGYKIPAEIGAPHFKGTLAAARTGDGGNPQRKSSGSQFYVVQGHSQSEAVLNNFAKSGGFSYNEAQIKKYAELGGRPDLDNKYTVFGEVIEGLDVIDKIGAVPTQGADRPIKDVKMKIRMLN